MASSSKNVLARDCEISWAEARIKIARVTLTIKLDGNWNSFQLANSAPPVSAAAGGGANHYAAAGLEMMAPSRAFRLCLQAQQNREFNACGLVSGSPRPTWWQESRASETPKVSACGPAPAAAIAQLGERQTEGLKVPGSIPGLGIHLFL